jgi:hypothetical protein
MGCATPEEFLKRNNVRKFSNNDFKNSIQEEKDPRKMNKNDGKNSYLSALFGVIHGDTILIELDGALIGENEVGVKEKQQTNGSCHCHANHKVEKHRIDSLLISNKPRRK